jgi:hypothetical protein
MEPNWKYCRGTVGATIAFRTYRDDELGVQREIVTRRKRDGSWLEGVETYYIDGNPSVFTDEAEMLRQLDSENTEELFCLCGRKISQ